MLATPATPDSVLKDFLVQQWTKPWGNAELSILRKLKRNVIQVYGIQLRHMEALLCFSEIHDTVINGAMQMCQRRNDLMVSLHAHIPSVLFMDSFFYVHMTAEGYSFEDFLRIYFPTRTHALNFFMAKNSVFVPVHIPGHWVDVTIDHGRKEMKYQDSMSQNEHYIRSSHAHGEEVISSVKRILIGVINAYSLEIDLDSYSCIFHDAHCSQQCNRWTDETTGFVTVEYDSVNCAMHVAFRAVLMSNGFDTNANNSIVQDDILRAREQLAIDLAHGDQALPTHPGSVFEACATLCGGCYKQSTLEDLMCSRCSTRCHRACKSPLGDYHWCHDIGQDHPIVGKLSVIHTTCLTRGAETAIPVMISFMDPLAGIEGVDFILLINIGCGLTAGLCFIPRVLSLAEVNPQVVLRNLGNADIFVQDGKDIANVLMIPVHPGEFGGPNHRIITDLDILMIRRTSNTDDLMVEVNDIEETVEVNDPEEIVDDAEVITSENSIFEICLVSDADLKVMQQNVVRRLNDPEKKREVNLEIDLLKVNHTNIGCIILDPEKIPELLVEMQKKGQVTTFQGYLPHRRERGIFADTQVYPFFVLRQGEDQFAFWYFYSLLITERVPHIETYVDPDFCKSITEEEFKLHCMEMQVPSEYINSCILNLREPGLQVVKINGVMTPLYPMEFSESNDLTAAFNKKGVLVYANDSSRDYRLACFFRSNVAAVYSTHRKAGIFENCVVSPKNNPSEVSHTVVFVGATPGSCAIWQAVIWDCNAECFLYERGAMAVYNPIGKYLTKFLILLNIKYVTNPIPN